MKLRGYISVFTNCDGKNGFSISEFEPSMKYEGNKYYTFIIDVPHNLPELKTVEGLEELK